MGAGVRASIRVGTGPPCSPETTKNNSHIDGFEMIRKICFPDNMGLDKYPKSSLARFYNLTADY